MRMWLLARALRDRGHDVTWWSSTFSHQRKRLLADTDVETIADGVRLRLLSAGSYPRNVSVARARHHRTLTERFMHAAASAPAPDLVVTAFPIVGLADAATRFATRLGVPSVVDVRDVWPDVFVDKAPRGTKGMIRLLTLPMARTAGRTLARATGIVGVSPSYLDWGLRHAGRTRTRDDAVFYLGCGDPGRPDPSLRESQGPVTFLFVGSFGLSYDLDLVCDAAALLAEAVGTDAKVVLAGSGEQYERIASRARAAHNVELTGWVGQSQVRTLLAGAHVGLSPVRSVANPSTLSNKIFEYLGAGLPVISSVEGETTELLRRDDVGTAYDRGDARVLADAMIRYVGDPSLRVRQAGNARRLFESRFDADIIYPAYANHLEGVHERTTARR